ncbi:hypothetical protein HQ590_13955 [bacterium]|nr:hypothetical protein [bacterium]
MLSNRSITFLLLAGLVLARPLAACELGRAGAADRAERADAICRGKVIRSQSYRDRKTGHIYTRTVVRVQERIKGKKPRRKLRLVLRGGVVGGEGESYGGTPTFQQGDEHLFYLRRQPNGSYALIATDNGPAARVTATASGSSLAGAGVTGMATDANGVSSRYLTPDRGEPIPYLVDAQALPAGITVAQATNAVRQAFDAWAAVTSLQFEFGGLTNLGVAASAVTNRDGRIYIQLHDLHNAITGPTTLGIGGSTFTFDPVSFPLGGAGGRVGPDEFHEVTRGFVVLEHTQATIQNPVSLAEAVCHELGHALSLSHSSEVPGEPDATLKQAMMYYQIHADGRGAALGSYDPPVVRQAYPPDNTPPYGYPRVIEAVTSSTALANPDANQVEVIGYDRQGTALTRSLTNGTANGGTFSVAGPTLTYAPSGLFTNVPLDPAGTEYYDRVFVRFDDGTNASPPMLVRVIALWPDTRPIGAPDGLPDDWMTAYFGTITPVAGLSRPGDDPDRDDLTNLGELVSGSDPTDANSALHPLYFDGTALGWQARPYGLYEIYESTDLVNWTSLLNPVIPTTSTGRVERASSTVTPTLFLRVRQVP